MTSHAMSNRWGNLENTSLPARMAPKLVPTTLAQATQGALTQGALTQGAQARSGRPAPTLDDFPSLQPKAPKVAPKVEPKVAEAPKVEPKVAEAPKVEPKVSNYASLSREWAKKQKEDEIAQKEKAAAEVITQRFLQEQREKDFEEKQMIRRIRVGMTHIPRLRKPDSDEEKYSEKSSEEEILSDEPEEVYEEEEEEEEDDVWNGRKHRDDLY